MPAQLWWYVARTTGVVAWAAAAASIVVGLAMSTGLAGGHRARRLHNWLAGTTVAMVLLHLVSLVLDDYVTFDVVDLLVPGASDWNPVAVAWGIAAMYLLAAVTLTSLVRSRLSRRVWRGVHLLSLVLFWTASVHAVTAGSDLQEPALAWTVIGTTVVLTVMVLLRIAQAAVPGARARLARRRRAALAPQASRTASARSSVAWTEPSSPTTMADASRNRPSPATPETTSILASASAHHAAPAITVADRTPDAVGRPVAGSMR
ncbi:MAG: ferric reductase-like transmembrane domain-containing protein [Acidimicrobiales bacterium]